jgi:small acid-soluble spore protein F (minor alpha/beta-type SASP)
MRYYDFIDSKLVKKTPFKKVIKAKLKSNKRLSLEEEAREKQKYEIAEELGLLEKVKEYGWSGLTSSETGKIGGIMTQRNRERRIKSILTGKIPKW